MGVAPSHRTMLKLAPSPEAHLCARLLYFGLLLCLAATACAEHSTGKRLMRNHVLDQRAAAGTFVHRPLWWPLPIWRRLQLWRVPLATLRAALLVCLGVAALVPDSVAARLAAALAVSASGVWQFSRLGDHSLHLAGAAIWVPLVAPPAAVPALLRALVGWHLGSAGLGKLRTGGLAWGSGDARAATTRACCSAGGTDGVRETDELPWARWWMRSVHLALPRPLLAAAGYGALLAEVAVVPLWALSGCAPPLLSFALFKMHFAIWTSTSMCFWPNLAVYAAAGIVHAAAGDAELLGAALVSAPLWVASLRWTEDWPVASMAVFAYTDSQAAEIGRRLLGSRRVVAFAQGAAPRAGDAIGTLGAEGATAALDLAATTLRTYGAYATYGVPGIAALPCPHREPAACADAAATWLRENPRFFDAARGVAATRAAVVDAEDGRVLRVVALAA